MRLKFLCNNGRESESALGLGSLINLCDLIVRPDVLSKIWQVVASLDEGRRPNTAGLIRGPEVMLARKEQKSWSN